jgi:hypothetical protein
MRMVQLAMVVALTCAGSVGILAYGAHPGAHVLPSGRHPAAPVRAKGNLVGVDLAQRTVTLALQHSTLTMRVDAGTAVFVGGRFGSISELPLGAPVCAAVDGRAWPTAEWLEPC